MKLKSLLFFIIFLVIAGQLYAQKQIKIERSYKVLPDTNQRLLTHERHYNSDGELVNELTYYDSWQHGNYLGKSWELNNGKTIETEYNFRQEKDKRSISYDSAGYAVSISITYYKNEPDWWIYEVSNPDHKPVDYNAISDQILSLNYYFPAELLPPKLVNKTLKRTERSLEKYSAYFFKTWKNGKIKSKAVYSLGDNETYGISRRLYYWPNGHFRCEYQFNDADSFLIKSISKTGSLLYEYDFGLDEDSDYKYYKIRKLSSDTNKWGEPTRVYDTLKFYDSYNQDSLHIKTRVKIELYSYDSKGRIIKHQTVTSLNDTTLNSSYEYDGNGNQTRIDYFDYNHDEGFKPQSKIQFNNQNQVIYNAIYDFVGMIHYKSSETFYTYKKSALANTITIVQTVDANTNINNRIWMLLSLLNSGKQIPKDDLDKLHMKMSNEEWALFEEMKSIGWKAFYEKHAYIFSQIKHTLEIKGDTIISNVYRWIDKKWQFQKLEKKLKTWQSGENFEKMLLLESVIKIENNLIVETWNYNSDLASTLHSKQIGADSNNLQTTLTEEWSYGQQRIPRKYCEYQINRTIIRFNETRLPDSAYKAAGINYYDQLVLPVNTYTKRELINGKLLVVEKSTRNHTTQEFLPRTLNSITWERFLMNSTTQLLELTEKCKLTERSYIPNPSGHTFQADEEYYKKESKQLVLYKTTGHSYNNRNQPMQIHEVYFDPYSKEISHTQTSEYQYNTNSDITLKKEPVFGNTVTVVWEYEYY